MNFTFLYHKTLYQWNNLLSNSKSLSISVLQFIVNDSIIEENDLFLVRYMFDDDVWLCVSQILLGEMQRKPWFDCFDKPSPSLWWYQGFSFVFSFLSDKIQRNLISFSAIFCFSTIDFEIEVEQEHLDKDKKFINLMFPWWTCKLYIFECLHRNVLTLY